MKLNLEATLDTPEVEFNTQENHYYIRGNCYPADPAKFYNPLLEFMQQLKPELEITIDVELKYINSASSIYLMMLFNVLGNRQGLATIIWRYQKGDADIKSLGEKFEDSCEVKFTHECI